MIARYTRPEMEAIWGLENRFRSWLKVEVAACEAGCKIGYIPPEALAIIREKADFDLNRIMELQEKVKHELIAFLTAVAEKVGPEARYIHYGLTSSDIMDTALSLQMVQSLNLITSGVRKIREILKTRAREHKKTVMVGRTHGIHAEPTTFGLKLALWYEDMGRNLRRLQAAQANVRVGKLSGAVGTYFNIDPRVEEMTCRELGLNPSPISTQVLQRDRHAEYMSTLAILGASLEKIATEIRNLQRTDIHEVEEGFGSGQKGSSAMPHKKNPEICERITGLSRILKANVQASLDTVALWHERDLTNTSVERVIIPDSSILADYVVDKMAWVLDRLVVFPERMQQNLDSMKGLIFSGRMLLRLADKGLDRDKAYEMIQRNSMKVWAGEGDLCSLLKQDAEVCAIMPPEEIDQCFDISMVLKNAELIFDRLGLS